MRQAQAQMAACRDAGGMLQNVCSMPYEHVQVRGKSGGSLSSSLCTCFVHSNIRYSDAGIHGSVVLK